MVATSPFRALKLRPSAGLGVEWNGGEMHESSSELGTLKPSVELSNRRRFDDNCDMQQKHKNCLASSNRSRNCRFRTLRSRGRAPALIMMVTRISSSQILRYNERCYKLELNLL